MTAAAEAGSLVVPVKERFLKASEVPDAWGLNMVLYGPPGAGKTTLASTAQDSPHGKNVLYLDVEGGTRSIAHRKDIDILRMETWDDLRQFFDYITTEDHKYRTFVIDSLTELQSKGLAHLVRESGRQQPSQDEYVRSNSQIKAVVSDFVGLSQTRGWNMIFTCIERDFPSKSGGVEVRPALTDKASEGVIQTVDVVAYLSIDGDGNRKLMLRPSGIYVAKVRQPQEGPQLPDTIEDPDLVQILALLKSGGK